MRHCGYWLREHCEVLAAFFGVKSLKEVAAPSVCGAQMPGYQQCYVCCLAAHADTRQSRGREPDNYQAVALLALKLCMTRNYPPSPCPEGLVGHAHSFAQSCPPSHQNFKHSGHCACTKVQGTYHAHNCSLDLPTLPSPFMQSLLSPSCIGCVGKTSDIWVLHRLL